jgi:hypothetical protein
VPFVKAQSAMSRASSFQTVSGLIDSRYSREVIADCCKLVTDEINKEIANKKNVLVVFIFNPALPH